MHYSNPLVLLTLAMLVASAPTPMTSSNAAGVANVETRSPVDDFVDFYTTCPDPDVKTKRALKDEFVNFYSTCGSKSKRALKDEFVNFYSTCGSKSKRALKDEFVDFYKTCSAGGAKTKRAPNDESEVLSKKAYPQESTA